MDSPLGRLQKKGVGRVWSFVQGAETPTSKNAPPSRPNRYPSTKMFFCLLLSIFLLLQPSDAIYANTCRHDRQCISRHGVGSCCAPRRPIFSPLPICKSAGEPRLHKVIAEYGSRIPAEHWPTAQNTSRKPAENQPTNQPNTTADSVEHQPNTSRPISDLPPRAECSLETLKSFGSRSRTPADEPNTSRLSRAPADHSRPSFRVTPNHGWGKVGDICQRSGERLSYPTSVWQRQYIFTCPCAVGLRCRLSPGYDDIGTCVRN
ncbi:Hypp1053 [Branchiostoma lanceolatum]|uniref:Hypp1053 protein n=1 Tax=Branchiostoma lanceolatum TaxID=7740 RepID=A0A8K0EJ42_BRALA|nr:Hypp1053 [Branchiostoma lanceolatum]